MRCLVDLTVEDQLGVKRSKILCRCMEFFLVEGRSCSYDDERIYGIEVLLRYKHIVK